jgi:hypothetical protein
VHGILEVTVTDSDLTVAVLREIRDEVRGTNKRLDATNQRLDSLELSVSTRLDVVEHTLQGVAGQLVILGRYVKNSIEDLRERVTRLETAPSKKRG